MRYIIGLCLFGMLILVEGYGQEVPRVISFSKANYQAFNQNWSITQTRNGVMYIGNSAGLLEYDGEVWRRYPLPDKQIVRAVAVDSLGHIFVGGYGEFGFWQADERGELAYHSLRQLLPAEIGANEEIWHILVDSEFVLFQSFSEIYLYDYQTVRQLPDPGSLLFGQRIGDQWIIPVMQQGPYRWTPQTGFHPLPGGKLLAEQRIKALIPISGKSWLAATEKMGIYRYQPQVGFQPWPTQVDRELQEFQINRVVRLRNGHLAVGTILNGLYVLDETGQLRYHLNKESGLQNNTVLALHQDQQGDLWLGLDRGIDLVLLSQPLTFFPDVRGTVGTVYDAALMGDRLFLGSNQGLYVRRQGSREDFTLVEGTQGQVWDLFVQDGNLWGGHNNGTFRLLDNRIEWLSGITGGWCTRPYPGREDVLIQSTYTGFVTFRKQQGQWRFAGRIRGLQTPIKRFYFDEAARIWALHPSRGLWQLQLNDRLDSLVNIREYTEADGLPTTYGLGLSQIDGQILVRSDNSFYRWSSAGDRWLVQDSIRGLRLPTRRLSLLPGLEDEWFLADHDALKWYRADRRLSDLPLTLVPNFERVVRLDSSRYLFCLDNGYALLDRKAPIPATTSGSLLISQLDILSEDTTIYFPFRLGVRSPEWELPPQQLHLRVQYAFSLHGREVQYRFRLLGWQEQWSDWAPRHSWEVANLSHGTYTFELQSDQSDELATGRITVLPHWYETKLAYVVYLLLALFISTFLWHWHQFRLSRQRRHLERQREQELEQERIRQSHQQLQKDVLRKSEQLANSTFNLVRKNEILTELKSSLAAQSPPDQRQLTRMIDQHLSDGADWQVFEANFKQVHEVFFKRLKTEYPQLTPGDLRLAAYLRMNLTSKEIMPLLNISLRGVENKRYRLRRKLRLGADDNLVEFLMQY